MKHLNIKIYGQVQGVFFRDSARKKAEEIGIFGFIRNEPDGSVYIEAEGEEEKLKELLDWCKKGSELAEVKKVETKEVAIKNYDCFVVSY
ncbi:MAG: acylphosphatase [Patescibacteria group bacterium]